MLRDKNPWWPESEVTAKSKRHAGCTPNPKAYAAAFLTEPITNEIFIKLSFIININNFKLKKLLYILFTFEKIISYKNFKFYREILFKSLFKALIFEF